MGEIKRTQCKLNTWLARFAASFILLLSIFTVSAQSVQIEIADGGGAILESPANASNLLQAGYAVLESTAMDFASATAGFAILSVQSDGVLKSELVLPAVETITSGRLYIDDDAAVSTGIAIANPGSNSAQINFFFSDDNDTEINGGGFELDANEQIIAFTNAFPFGLTEALAGTLTISSTEPVAINGIRILVNELGDAVLARLPVAPTEEPVAMSTAYLPLFIQGTGLDGDEITSTTILVNPTDTMLNGQVIVDKSDGQSAPFYNYSIQPRSMWRSSDYDFPSDADLPANFVSGLLTGSVRIVPAAGTNTPDSFILLSDFYDPDPGAARTASELSLDSVMPATGFRFLIENINFDSPDESLTYSFYITDVSGQANSVMFELMQLDGSLLLPAEMMMLDAGTGTQLTLADIFTIPPSFSGGVLRISSTGDIIAKALRSRSNSEGAPILMALPGTRESLGDYPYTAFFPLVTESGGYSTEFFVFSAHTGSFGPGSLTSYGGDGNAIDLGILQRDLPIIESDQLDGTFHVLASDGQSNTVTTATFDGIGAGVTSDVEGYSGTETQVNPPASITYVAAQNNRLGLILDPGDDEQTFEGIISEDGRSFLLLSTDEEPNLLTGHKQGNGLLTHTILNGEYIAGASNDESNSLVVFNFDGAGAGTWGVSYDLLEGEPPSLDFIPLSYTVDSAGIVTVNLAEDSDEQVFVGSVSSDGSSLNLVEITDPATMLIAALKSGPDLTLAELDGRYVGGALLGSTTEGFALEFDGLGGGSIVVEDSLGNIIAMPYSFTYSVAEAGQLELQVDPGGGGADLPLRGMVSEDRSQLVLVAGAGTEPILVMGIKAPAE